MLGRLLPHRVRRDLFAPGLQDLRTSRIAKGRTLGGGYWLHVVALWLDCWRVGVTSPLRFTSRIAQIPRPTPTSRDLSMDSLLQDLRYALRTFRSSPGFTLVAALTLGLGIGANAAIFNVVDAFLFRDLGGVTDNDSLVWVMSRDAQTSLFLGNSYPNFEDIRDNTDVFSGMLAYTQRPVSLQADGRAERVFVEVTTANYFDVLGAQPAVGRTFAPSEGGAEGSGAVVMLSWSYWQRRFGGDPNIVGTAVQVNGIPYTIVGVAPREYEGLESLLGIDAYVPDSMLNALDDGSVDPRDERRAPAFRVVARLAANTSVNDAQQALDVIAAELERLHPEDNRNRGLAVFPEKQGRPDPSIGGQFAPVAALFMGMVGLVLLIACANVANLLLARASGRGREIAVRSALGAGRWRVVRQLATESALLGVAGGAVGVVLAIWATGALRRIVAGWQIEIPLKLPIEIDPRTIVFCFVAAVLAGLLAGLTPALQSARSELTAGLREGGRSASGGRRQTRLRSTLVAVQVAVSLVLLVTAGLFVRSLGNARNAALGFLIDNRLMVSVDAELVDYDEITGRELYQEILEGVQALPGVRSVALNSSPAFSPRLGFANARPEDSTPEEFSDAPWHIVQRVSPGYLETAGTRLLAGRDFTEADNADSRHVALINETMADRYWPDRDAVGQRFVTGSGTTWEVIGIVEAGKYNIIWEPPMPAMLLPIAQSWPSTVTVLVHTDGDPLTLADPVRHVISAIDPDLPIFSVMSMSTHLNDGRAFMIIGLAATLVSAFGLAGVLLAGVGLYGVIAYSVGQRAREFGVRIALGAEPGSVIRLVMRQGVRLGLVGLLAGGAAAFVAARLAQSLLIGVSAADPLTYGVVAMVVLAISLLACALPAWRATRVSPIDALRAE